MKMLELQQVSFTYPEEKAPLRRRGDLSEIDLTMAAGDTAAVLGVPGSGIQTLLRLVAGVDHPTSGRVLWRGIPVDGPATQRGMVFHQSSLYPWLSVTENVEFGLKNRKVPRRERKARVAEYLERFHLTRLATQRVYRIEDYHHLILISFARCLVTEPEIVLIGDEPLNEINDRFRLKLQKILLQLWQDKKPMLLTATSDVEAALTMAAQVYILGGRPGRLRTSVAVPFFELAATEGMEAVRHLPAFREMRQTLIRHII
ncbi:MAG: ATP-binding cassette domain-containing protein [Desulfosarcinaceae bacterium]|nr:ATP-binding cassette domain-containing protein [Desulfosarcinaceae bacterium]